VDQAVGKDVDLAIEEDMDQTTGQDVDQTELDTRYFFPGLLIANSLFLDLGSLSLNR